MLKLWLFDHIGNEFIRNGSTFFDAEYEPEWITEDLVKEMIKDVDKSEVIAGEYILSPVLGPIPPKSLSRGVKTLIMASHDSSRIYNLTSCGDNCAKWVIKLAENRDINMRLGHYMDFSDVSNFKVQLMATGEIITNYDDLLDALRDAESAYVKKTIGDDPFYQQMRGDPTEEELDYIRKILSDWKL